MAETQPIGERISEIRKEFCNGKNKEFAAKLGITEQNSSSYCKGRIKVGNRTINRILRTFPQVNRRWLMFGEGEMVSNGSRKIIPSEKTGNTTPLELENNEILEKSTSYKKKGANDSKRKPSPSADSKMFTGSKATSTESNTAIITPSINYFYYYDRLISILENRDRQIERMLNMLERQLTIPKPVDKPSISELQPEEIKDNTKNKE